MKICDLTNSYTPTSGGIRRYIDQKRKYLLEHTDHEHVLVIPAEHDEIERDGRATTIRIASPVIPGCAPYRFFWRPKKVRDVLAVTAPDVIELGSLYLSPWAAFSYRRQRQAKGGGCLIAAYFHTDIADAYVGTPLRKALAEDLEHWSDTLATLGLKVAHAAEEGAEDYFASVLNRCDVVMAATPTQAARVREYGEERVEVVPLGVDIQQFHPSKRSEEIRKEWGDPAGPVFLYAGRLDVEKHVWTLVEAFERLPRAFDARFVFIGDGPFRDELDEHAAVASGILVLPFESDGERLAALVASADVYVTAGPHETFGLSVIEAQASGLPVVGVDSGALRERVLDGLGYLGPVDSPSEMARLMQKAWRERGEIGPRARRHVVEHFSWDATFERVLELYGSKELH